VNAEQFTVDPFPQITSTVSKITEESMDSVCFGLSEPHESGFRSGLAMKGDLVVGVHQSQNKKDLWYRIGFVEIGIVRWMTGDPYDTGITPAVAITGSTVVEVHKSENHDRLYYHVGTVEGTTPDISINWSKSVDYDDGVQPRVAANASGLVVEVHKSQNEDALWYHVGHINGTSIKWEKSHKYTTGTHPAIALFDDGRVVEIHESENTEFLWYMTGNVSGDTIKWEKPVKYVEGRAPVIACDSPTGQVIEIHEDGSGGLVSVLGSIAGTSVTWGDSHHFDSGLDPAVAYSGWHAVQTHTSELSPEIFSSLSVVIDRKEWMRTRQEVLDQRKLYELILPATHDSGAYDLGKTHVPDACRTLSFDVPSDLEEPFARAQSRDLGGQLSRGIRYFDLRVIPQGNDFHAFHDLISNTKLSSALDQLAAFLGSVTRELVILKFSHFCQFDDTKHAELINLIVSKIGPYLYNQGTMTGEQVMKLYFRDVTKDGPRVLIHYHDKKDDVSYIKEHPTQGFLENLPTFDKSSNVDTYHPMHDDQLQKLKDNEANPDRFFLLSWTLTPKDDLSMVEYSSLHDMSHEPNRKLGSFCHQWARVHKMSFLYVDFFEDARAVDIAIQMNG
jgi:hypothetical protein